MPILSLLITWLFVGFVAGVATHVICPPQRPHKTCLLADLVLALLGGVIGGLLFDVVFADVETTSIQLLVWSSLVALLLGVGSIILTRVLTPAN